MKGFRDFITRGNLIDLAVAVVIGTAFTAIVTAIVKDFITPLIGAFFGGKNNSFENLTFTVHGSKFAYGDLINAIVTFLLIAAVVYFLIVAPMARLVLRLHGVKEATTRDCPECLSSIPLAAKRCMYCMLPQTGMAYWILVMVASLLFAYAFYVLAERPSHKLARRIKVRWTEAIRRDATSETAPVESGAELMSQDNVIARG